MDRFHTRRPLLVDSSLNTALAVQYFILFLFGLAGVFAEIPAIEDVAGTFVSHVLGGIIAGLALLSCVAVLHSMVNSRWERREFYATASLTTFMCVYTVALGILAFMGYGDDRTSQFIASAALLVLPIWKISFILKKNSRR